MREGRRTGRIFFGEAELKYPGRLKEKSAKVASAVAPMGRKVVVRTRFLPRSFIYEVHTPRLVASTSPPPQIILSRQA